MSESVVGFSEFLSLDGADSDNSTFLLFQVKSSYLKAVFYVLESTVVNVYVSGGVCVFVCVYVCVGTYVYNSNRFHTGEYHCPGVFLFDFFIDCAVKKDEKGFPVL